MAPFSLPRQRIATEGDPQARALARLPRDAPHCPSPTTFPARSSPRRTASVLPGRAVEPAKPLPSPENAATPDEPKPPAPSPEPAAAPAPEPAPIEVAQLGGARAQLVAWSLIGLNNVLVANFAAPMRKQPPSF